MSKGNRPEEATVRVFLADPHTEARGRLRRAIERETDLQVVGEGEPDEETYAQIVRTSPDVLVACLGRNDAAVQLCRDVRGAEPAVKCIVLTAFDEDEALLRAILVGATDFVASHASEEEIVAAVRDTTTEGRAIEGKLAEWAERAPPLDEMTDMLKGLTVQQRRVAELVAEGLTNPEIAEELDVSVNTVRNYLSHVMLKLQKRNRVEVATFMATLARRQRQSTRGS